MGVHYAREAMEVEGTTPEDDQATIYTFQRVGLDLETLPREVINTLHDGVIIEL